MSRGGGVTGTAASPSPRAMLGPLLPRTVLGRSGPGPPARSAPSLGLGSVGTAPTAWPNSSLSAVCPQPCGISRTGHVPL